MLRARGIINCELGDAAAVAARSRLMQVKEKEGIIIWRVLTAASAEHTRRWLQSLPVRHGKTRKCESIWAGRRRRLSDDDSWLYYAVLERIEGLVFE